MDPNDIELENLSKNFEYHKLASEVDKMNSVEDLRNLTKSYIKLYYKQQEVLTGLGLKGI